jgi:hypothetical protein
MYDNNSVTRPSFDLNTFISYATTPIPYEELEKGLRKRMVMFTEGPQELFFIAQALAIAVDHDFMAREHGAKIWKRTLANSGFDLPKGENK